jgi:hypothetical protein
MPPRYGLTPNRLEQHTNRFQLRDFAEIKLGIHLTGSFGGQQQLAVYYFREQQGPPL